MNGRMPWLFAATLALTPILAGGNNFWFGDAAGAQLVWFLLALMSFGWTLLSRSVGFRELLAHRVLWPFFGLMLWLVFTLPFAEVADTAIRHTLWWLAAMLLGLTALYLRLTTRQIIVCVALLLSSAAFTAIYGLYQGFVLLPQLAADTRLNGQDLRLAVESQRPFSLYLGANPFGGYMAALAPLGVLLVVNTKARWLKVLGGLGFALLLLGMIVSFSRGAWMVFILGLIPMALLLLRGRMRVALIAVVAGILVSLYVFMNLQSWLGDSRDVLDTPLAARLTSITDAADVSIQARVSYWRTAFDMGLSHPLLGVGLGNYENLARRFQSLPNYTRDPHNIWLKFFAETGLVGLALFVAFVLVLARSLLRRGQPAGHAPLSPWLLLSLGLLLLHGSIDIDFAAPIGPTLFFVLAAFLLSPDLPPVSNKGRPTDPVWRALVAVFAVLILFGVQFFALFGQLYSADAQWAMQQNSHSKAREFNESAIDYWPLDAQVYYQQSRLLMADYKMSRNPADLKGALENVNRAISLNPHNPEYFVGLADLMAMNKQLPKVIDALKTAAALYPSSIHYQSEFARALSLSGNHAAALHVLNTAIGEYEPLYLRYRSPNGMDLVGAHYLRAAILNDDGQWDAARAEYENIIKLCGQPGLVLNAYTSSRQGEAGCDQIIKQAREYIDRIAIERQKPPELQGPPPDNMPQVPENIPLRLPGGPAK
jgi:O-antigen ligase